MLDFLPIHSNKFYFCGMKVEFLKRLTSLLLSLLFIYNAMGYFVAYKSSRYFNRLEMRAAIRKKASLNSLEVIKISLLAKNNQASEIQFIKKNEIKYHGRFYDIVRRKNIGDSVFFYCLHDKKEEAIIKNFHQHVETYTTTNLPLNHKHPNILKLIVKDFIPLFYVRFDSFCLSELFYFEYSQTNRNFIPGIPYPPPKIYTALKV